MMAELRSTSNIPDGMYSEAEDVWIETGLRPKELLAKYQNLVLILGDEISGQCSEHFQSGGLRFYGISWEHAKQILEKHDYKPEQPF